MRLLWKVCLLGLGVAATGACSARSLLTVQLTTEKLRDGERVEGNPRIDVYRNGDRTTPVHTVDKSGLGDAAPFWLLVDGSTKIGVYLPSDVEGLVVLTAALHGGACDWSGTAPPVAVHAGWTASTEVVLERGTCVAPPDVVPGDGGADGADGDGGDDGPTLVGTSDAGDARDGGLDAEDVRMKCAAYCTAYRLACLDPNDPSAALDCNRACFMAAWPDGTAAAPTGENTFACRWDHLKVVAQDAALSCSECYAASPASSGVCAPADAGTLDACPLD
jgi:hypothetical protein